MTHEQHVRCHSWQVSRRTVPLLPEDLPEVRPPGRTTAAVAVVRPPGGVLPKECLVKESLEVAPGARELRLPLVAIVRPGAGNKDGLPCYALFCAPVC